MEEAVVSASHLLKWTSSGVSSVYSSNHHAVADVQISGTSNFEVTRPRSGQNSNLNKKNTAKPKRTYTYTFKLNISFFLPMWKACSGRSCACSGRHPCALLPKFSGKFRHCVHLPGARQPLGSESNYAGARFPIISEHHASGRCV